MSVTLAQFIQYIIDGDDSSLPSDMQLLAPKRFFDDSLLPDIEALQTNLHNGDFDLIDPLQIFLFNQLRATFNAGLNLSGF